MAFALPVEVSLTQLFFFIFFPLLPFRFSPPYHWEGVSGRQGKIFLTDGFIAWHGVIWLQRQGLVYVSHMTDCATIKKPSFTHSMPFLVDFSADTVSFFFKVCLLKRFPVEICHLLKAKNSNVMPI